MEVRFATAAAPGRPNEDYALAIGDLVVVFDGVTQLADATSGCVHGPAWYVRRLSARLCAGYVAAPGRTLAQLLADAIDAVRGDHGQQCDLTHPGTPASTVCALKVCDGRVEYLVLCDSSIVLDTGADVTVISDNRIQATIQRLRQQPITSAGQTYPAAAGGFLASTPGKYQFTNRPDGYWIAAADPQAAFEAIHGEVPTSGPARLRRAALMSDGASCAVDPYSLLSWSALLDLVTESGPAELIRTVRAAERTDPDGRAYTRHKRHDDATIATCLFSEETQ